jgi:hypothetical protein
VADETRARKEGERELRKRLEDGQSAAEALYRSWLRYHNRLGGADSWQAWERRYLADATRKEAAMKKSVRKAIAAAAPDAPSVPHVTVRPAPISGAGNSTVPALGQFEREVEKAQEQLARARKSGDTYGIAAASTALKEAQYRLTGLKMVAAENARERDPAAVMRSLRGQGVPLLSNRHALRDDPSLRGI